MTVAAVKTDTHAAVAAPVYGPNVFEIVNKRTGHVFDRVVGYAAALAAQKAADANVARTGQ